MPAAPCWELKELGHVLLRAIRIRTHARAWHATRVARVAWRGALDCGDSEGLELGFQIDWLRKKKTPLKKKKNTADRMSSCCCDSERARVILAKVATKSRLQENIKAIGP